MGSVMVEQNRKKPAFGVLGEQASSKRLLAGAEERIRQTDEQDPRYQSGECETVAEEDQAGAVTALEVAVVHRAQGRQGNADRKSIVCKTKPKEITSTRLLFLLHKKALRQDQQQIRRVH